MARATDIALNDGVWHFVVVTWTNQDGAWQIFIDGKFRDGGASLSSDSIILGTVEPDLIATEILAFPSASSRTQNDSDL